MDTKKVIQYFWKVYPSIVKRIKTADDLNDFYAYMDYIGESVIDYKTQEEYVEKIPTFTMLIPLSEMDRIDELTQKTYYEVGSYNEENVKRILGRYYKHEHRLLCSGGL